MPTGYGEMLYGIHRGFTEMREAGVIATVPRLYSCEPAARGPLARAIASGQPVVEVAAAPTVAFGIACRVNGFRGVSAITESDGRSLLLTDEEMMSAADELARQGMWQETSCGSSLAGLRQMVSNDLPQGPVVCVVASQGVKLVGRRPSPTAPHATSWQDLTTALKDHYSFYL